MKPAYDQHLNLTLWLDQPSGNFFDPDMNWIGFVSNEHAFSSATLNWLGPLDEATFRDTRGKAVLWMPDLGSPTSGFAPHRPFKPFKPFAPFTPFKPFTPFTPFKPFAPAGGWSTLSAIEWLQGA
ncbi:4-fold beta flower protein [Burkholderia arboris]|uniref:4-fold beta flower protein n=1 Tax=Burkholderia arboris TaxID=488730 RepID=UPI001CF51D68|nr:hypothetical protein [Burkholderia arboris]MCA8048037.1 hypothetical protein [Burkholderia arboris]